MCNRGGILRIVIVSSICFCLIVYNAYGYLFKQNNNIKKITSQTYAENFFAYSEENTNITDISSTESIETKTSIAETPSKEIPVSAGAVKGKVLNRYISPYSAGISYNNVYVRNSTDLNIDIKTLLNSSLTFSLKKSDKPEVLIIHTHATESFMETDSEYYTEEYTSRSCDNEKNMVAIGNIISDKLNSSGIKTIHETKQHDYPMYSGCYSRAAETICNYIKKYPSIKIVMDLHRDAISSGDSDKVKVTTEINGKKAAQVMIVIGSQSGGVTNFPNWQENFKLALKMQQAIEVNYPTLARPVSLMPKNYNESLTTGSVLIEFGTDANTLDEAKYSAEMVGDSLSKLFNTLN